MIHDQRAEKFRQIVENKFQIYNSLFMSLPYDKMTNIGMLLPFLYEESRTGYEAGKTPEEIVEEFFKIIPIFRLKNRNLNCFLRSSSI
jgi:phosphoenolpyruvate carboxylase